MAQFKAYYEASRLHILPAQQQHAYLRCNLHPDVWIAIQERITLTTRIFKNDLQLDEDSCEKLIEDTFQVRYPLIMRRYRFFTFERKGNQTFTNFYGRLIELASAAQLEKMGRNLVIMKKKRSKYHAIRTTAQDSGDPGVNTQLVIETVVEKLSQERDSA